jgi:acyl carrier protein
LAGALAGQALEVALIWSNAAARIGGTPLSAVSAMALDSEAARWRATTGVQWMNVNSAAWRHEPETAASQAASQPDAASISTAEGLEAFRLILASSSVTRVHVASPDTLSQQGQRPHARSTQVREAAKNPAGDVESNGQERETTTNDAFESDVERDVAAIWQRLLRVEQIGPHDNFFDLGGHSLLASQLLSHLRERFNVQLPLESLFEAPTVSEVAKQIDALLTADEHHGMPPLCPVPRDAPLPLSYAQQRLWFLDQLVPGSPFYNVPIAVRLSGQLSQATLARCIDAIVERHEVLRTTFKLHEGVPLQHPNPALRVNPVTANLEGAPEEEREERARLLLMEEAQRPFDLESEPPLRALLVRLDALEHYLLLTLHHIVCDAWSIGLLLSEMAALYSAYSAGHQSALPPLPIQYADFSVWQRQWLRGRVLEEQLAYRTRQLDGLATLALPPSHPAPAEPTFRGEQQSFAFGLSLSKALKELGREEDSTLFMTLLAVFQSVLRHYTGQDDIVVGTDVANRTHAATESMIGFFANQLVLRSNLAGNPRFREILRRVRQVTLGAYENQELPFDKLVEAINPPRNPRGTPLFQVKFVLQNAPMPVLEVAGLRLSPLNVEHGTAKFDLLFNLEETEQGISGTLEYSTDIYDGAAAAQLIQDFESLAQHVVEQPDSSLDELSAFLAEQRRQRSLMKRQMRKTLQQEKLLNVRRKGRIRGSKEEVS